MEPADVDHPQHGASIRPASITTSNAHSTTLPGPCLALPIRASTLLSPHARQPVLPCSQPVNETSGETRAMCSKLLFHASAKSEARSRSRSRAIFLSFAPDDVRDRISPSCLLLLTTLGARFRRTSSPVATLSKPWTCQSPSAHRHARQIRLRTRSRRRTSRVPSAEASTGTCTTH